MARELNTPGAVAAREAASKQAWEEKRKASRQISAEVDNPDFEGVGDEGPGVALVDGRLSHFSSALGLARAGTLAGRTGLAKEVVTIPDATNNLKRGDSADTYTYEVNTPGARQRFVNDLLPDAPVVAKSARKQRLNEVRRDRPGLVGRPENLDKNNHPIRISQRRTVTE